jgi:hypothetical protein
MVNLVDDWEVLEEHAGEKQGFYQLLGVDGAIEIRVATGKLGFRKEFESGKDELLMRIQDFCKSKKFIRISENIRDEQFFK